MKTYLLTILLALGLLPASAQVTPASQMEKLDRGLIVVKQSALYKLVSWRLLGTDPENTTFDVLRNGEPIATGLTKTNYRVLDAKATNTYQVVVKKDGVEVERTPEVLPWADYYKSLTLDRPAGGTNASGSYAYTPNDCSVGDVDGDGEYELFVKWDPTNSKDNSQGGYTGNVYIDCYKFDGTKLWRIDLGVNIRAGAHYTQFMVYDFDGDGKVELMCKTAPGSKDGQGNYVNQVATETAIKNASNTKDWRNSGGRIDGGHEYLTVFNGETGAAIHTIAYNPNRNGTSVLTESSGTFNWYGSSGKSDYASYGNRGERYLAAVAYLDGPDQNPSGIFSRGYYTYAYIWAVDFDGRELKQKWFHASDSRTTYKVTNSEGTTKTYTAPAPTGYNSGSRTMYANGNHNLSIGDVDGDGRDEIIWGSAALDHDGTLLYSTGWGHGDAIHLADHNPDRPGLELFQVHEEGSHYGWDLHDAATGEMIHYANGSADNGRGMAADIVASNRGSEFWSAKGNRDPYSCVTGQSVGTTSPSMNFRIYWDGDYQEELLDGTNINKTTAYSSSSLYVTGSNTLGSYNTASCNSTKATPNLSADIFGDWREEVILWDKTDSCTLKIFSSAVETSYAVPTLMHDHVYRMGVAWQNVAYNQPPHLGYYLPDYIEKKGIFATAIQSAGTGEADEVVAVYDLNGQKVLNAGAPGIYIVKMKNGGTRKIIKR